MHKLAWCLALVLMGCEAHISVHAGAENDSSQVGPSFSPTSDTTTWEAVQAPFTGSVVDSIIEIVYAHGDTTRFTLYVRQSPTP
jgi:hypothetical protein